MRISRHFLAIIALFTIGLAVRYIPLLFSGLPFNIDGFPLVRISEDIVDTGHWSLSYPGGTSSFVTYNTKMPVMSLLISNFALIFGIAPLRVAQVIIPFLSSTALVIIYLVAYKITKNELVSFFAGLALALNGFYVYLGAAIMKETIGLVLLLLGVYLYQGREDPRKRVLASMLFLILALTHHLTAWIGFVMVSLLMIAFHAQKWHRGSFKTKEVMIDFVSGPFLFIFTILYYQMVNMVFFTTVSNINDIALFASIFMLGAVFCIIFSLPKKRKKPRNIVLNKTLIIPVAGLALLILNHYTKAFDTIRGSSSFLTYLLPYLLLITIALIGFNVVASKRTEYRPFIAALLLAPFLVILFALLKGFDPFTFMLVYRSYDYIDFGLAICAGIGIGYLINRLVKRFAGEKNASDGFRLKATLSVIFLIICISTVPLAYQGQEFYGVQDATYDHEFKAMSWLGENGKDYHISTDERLNDIMVPYFDLDCDKSLPLKFKYNEDVKSGTILFMEDKWLYDGAQMSPMEPIVISKGTFDRTLDRNNLIFSSSSANSQIYIVMVR